MREEIDLAAGLETLRPDLLAMGYERSELAAAAEPNENRLEYQYGDNHADDDSDDRAGFESDQDITSALIQPSLIKAQGFALCRSV